jgi:trans-2,3-dihydro-3-hydroxyanthranilate isomerase
MKFSIVDVFAERPLQGNQLAVVEDAGALSTEQMQDIAREMNYSETTFVTETGEARARVRIFTPEWELPFAGHPTLGTAWVLASGRGAYTLELAVGPVQVTFEDAMAWMVPPPVRLDGIFPGEQAAALVGLSEDRLDNAFPVRLAEVGPKFLLIGVRDLAALKASRLSEALHQEYLAAGLGVQCVFVFSTDIYSPDAQFAARMFFESGGVREDPATGSANSAFAAYLKDLGWSGRQVLVEQGVEIRRPSRLYLDLRDPLRVGGKVQPVAVGTLNF